MGKKDSITKEYLQDKTVFADAFNYLLYDGKPVIQPENLRSVGTELLELPYRGENPDAADKVVKRSRDLLMQAVMRDEKQTYLLLGIESQSEVHYTMPVRNMMYDVLQYSDQIKEHQQEKGRKGLSAGEYLSGLRKGEKLTPVVTLVIYFGSEKWDGPRTLQEMLEIQDPKLLPYIPNYQLNLISPRELTDEDLLRMDSNLREVLEFIKYSNDRAKLEEKIKDNDRYKEMNWRAVRVLNKVTNSKIYYEDREEKVDMCKALDEMQAESREKGRQEGRQEGREEGIRAGLERAIQTMLQNGIAAEKILDMFPMDKVLVQKLAKQLS